MDFNKFLGRLDESSAEILKEWKGAGATDSWASLPEDVKGALGKAGVSGSPWAYMPAGRDIVIVEEGSNQWSLFNLKGTIGESKAQRRSRRLNEAGRPTGRPSAFDIDGLEDEALGDNMAAAAAGTGAGCSATPVLGKVDFASCLKECVAIVKEDAYKER